MELVYLHTKQIIHVMGNNEKFKGWNSQTVRKSAESTVNTIRVRIKTVSQSVNGCNNKRLERYTTRRHALLVSNSKHHGDNKREVNIIPIDNDTCSQPLPYKNYMQFVTVNKISPKWHTLNLENCIASEQA